MRRQLALTETDRIPRDGLILGWGAMLPVAFFAGAAWFGNPEISGAARDAARIWGAALLLFFSGVRRGLSFRTEGGPRPAQLAGFAALFWAGLAALLLPTSWALALIALCLAALGVEDRRAARAGEAPLYFARLRPAQMAFASASVVLCWAAG